MKTFAKSAHLNDDTASSKHFYYQNYDAFLDLARFLFRFFILGIIDFFKIQYGLNSSRFILNLLFYASFLFTTSLLKTNYLIFEKKRSLFIPIIKSDLLFTLILVYDICELVSWNMIKEPFNTQALNAANLKTAAREIPGFRIYFVSIILFVISLIFLPFYHFIVQVPRIVLIIKNLHFVFLFIFFTYIFNNFHDKNNKSLVDFYQDYEYIDWLKKSLVDKMKMKPHVFTNSSKLKNLLLIQLESYPNEFVKDPNISPNLHNFSQIFEYVSPIFPQPYATWTVGSIILINTGIPQIMPDTDWKMRSLHKINYVLELKGIPDILSSAGYQLHYATTENNTIMGLEDWVQARNFTRVYSSKLDSDLFNFFTNEYLPKMDKEVRESNFESHFMGYFQNMDTHSPYPQPKWCNMNFPEIEKKERCFHCVDNLIGDLVRKFMELKMYEHTLMVIYPDHLPFSRDQKKPVYELFLLFPGIKKVEPDFRIKDEITYYDFGPTILDLMGIKKYQPEFPFGRNIYIHPNYINKSNESPDKFKKHHKPNDKDLALIYKFLHFKYGVKIGVSSQLTERFRCYANRKKVFYYSDRPCNETYN